MLIDVSDNRTFPTELERFVMRKLSSFAPEIKSKIQSHNIEHYNDVRIAIEEYLAPRTYGEEAFYESLVNLMDKYEFVVYHATKVISKSMLMNGLNINDWETYCSSMVHNFEMLGMNDSDIQKALTLIKIEYDRKYTQNRIKPNLCFFSGIELLEKEGMEYNQFCENIGGEVAKWALRKEAILYTPLHEAGVPYIVKFKIMFSKIAEVHKEDIAYMFISYYAAKLFWDYSFNIEFDSMTYQNVSSENILEIIPYLLKEDCMLSM